MQPKYSALIKVNTVTNLVEIYFARPVAPELIKEIQVFFSNFLYFEFKHLKHLSGCPYWLIVPPTYAAKDAALEVEKLLRAHNFEKIKIEISKIGGETTYKDTLIAD